MNGKLNASSKARPCSAFVAEVERHAFEFYEAIATPGAVAPEMPEFLYNEEVELDLDEIIDMEQEPEEELTPEEILDESIEEGAEEKRKQLASDIESGNVASGEGGEGDYAISKKVAEEEEEEEPDEFSPDVEDIEDFSPEVEDIEEVEEFTQPTDSIPEKSISVSIEHLRKKMSDDKEN